MFQSTKRALLMYFISEQYIEILRKFFKKIRQQNVRISQKNVRNYKNCSIVIPNFTLYDTVNNHFLGQKNLALEK